MGRLIVAICVLFGACDSSGGGCDQGPRQCDGSLMPRCSYDAAGCYICTCDPIAKARQP